MIHPTQSVTLVAVIITYYLLDFAFIRYYDRQRQAEGSGRSWDYTLMLLTALSIMIVQPLVLPVLSVPFSEPILWVLLIAGIILIASAFALHFWSRVHLRHFYAERVEIQPEHQIIDTGPYGYVRHPVFTSFYMIVIGILLINMSVLTFLLLIYALWDFRRAAIGEEAILLENLPAYAAYVRRTGRFLPRFLGGS